MRLLHPHLASGLALLLYVLVTQVVPARCLAWSVAPPSSTQLAGLWIASPSFMSAVPLCLLS
jgi:hypothetical protein